MELTEKQRENLTQIATIQVSHVMVKIQKDEGKLLIS